MEKKSESSALSTILANDKALGEIYKESGLFPDTKSKAQAIVKIQAGREIGLQPIEAMTGLNIFSGKISIGGNVMAAKVKGNPKYDYRATITDESCSIDFYEFTIDGKGKPIKELLGNSTFTMQDAKNAKLSTKDNWIKWKRNMMFNRALSNGVKWYCPDVFGSSPVYTPDELGIDENEAGEPINITPKESKPKKPAKQPKVVMPEPTKEPYHYEPDIDKSERKAEVEEFDERTEDGLESETTEVVVEESEESDSEEPEEETTLTIIPKEIINDIEKPRDALEKILQYTVQHELGKRVKPVVTSHYKAWETGEPSLCNIPETNIIRMVEELTGVKLKKKEKSHKCDCGKRITEAELEERDGFCMACWKDMDKED